MPQEMNLNYFIVLSHSGLKMCVSTPSRSHLIFIQVSRFASHLPQGALIHASFHPCGFSPQSRSLCLCLISIHVTSHLHPGPQNCISAPYKHPHNPIKDSRYMSHLHPGPISSGSGSNDLISPPYLYCLNPIQVHIVTSLLPTNSVSTPSRSWYSCVTSIQVTSPLHPGLKMYCMVHIYQCPISPPTRPFTRVVFHLNPCPDICISPPSRWRFTSIKFLKFASQLHPSPISKPSRSQDVCLTSIQALSQI